MNDFTQPQLDPAQQIENLPETGTAVVPADNSGKTDELSLAVEAANAPKPLQVKEVPAPEGKYWLEYFYKGKKHRETHATVPLALAGVRRLNTLGIQPSTGTL